MKKTKKYWHELPKEEVDELIKNGATIKYVLNNFKQPDWCNYDQALHFYLGCWTLSDSEKRTKICKEFCKDCDSFKK